MAESHSAERTALMTHLAHDLRGRIGGVMLMLELTRHALRDQAGLADAGADLEAARSSLSNVLMQLERHVLLHRLMEGAWPVTVRETDLSSLATDVAALAPPGRVSVQVAGAEDAVRTDATIIRAAAGELVDNALKFGSPPVAVVACAGTEGWSIGVRDTGPGIDPNRWDELMAGRADRRPGLGLRIARHAASLLGGRMEREEKAVFLNFPSPGQ